MSTYRGEVGFTPERGREMSATDFEALNQLNAQIHQEYQEHKALQTELANRPLDQQIFGGLEKTISDVVQNGENTVGDVLTTGEQAFAIPLVVGAVILAVILLKK